MDALDSKLRTPEEWCKLTGTHILDRDGWRMKDAPAWDEAITELDFHWRAGMSTARYDDVTRAKIVWRDPAPEPDDAGADCA